ncbi:MAG: cache domain-containing protein [Janthinobacterium lividum]
MHSYFNNKFSLPSFQKKYYIVFIISVFILTIIAGYINYSYQNFQKNLQQNLEVSANSIIEELERGFDDNEALLKYLGESITKSQSYLDLNNLSTMLMSTGEFNVRSLAKSYVSWATDEGLVIINGKKGVLHNDKPNILTRRYFETARKNPWKIQFSEVTQGLFNPSSILPIAMGIQNKSGEFLGYLILGLRIKSLREQLKKLTYNSVCNFIVLDQNLNLALASNEDLKKDFYQNQSNLKREIATGTFTKYTFSGSDVKCTIFKKFNHYPFFVLTGYSINKNLINLLTQLTPSILEFTFIALLSLIFLNIFKRKIITPINKLHDFCLQIHQRDKIDDLPYFNPSCV